MQRIPNDLPPLAERLLRRHTEHPERAFFDLFSIGSFFDSREVQAIDSAYELLEHKGLVRRVSGGVFSFGGLIRPLYKLGTPPEGRS